MDALFQKVLLLSRLWRALTVAEPKLPSRPTPQVRLDGADDGGPEQPVLGGQSQPALAIP